MIFSRILLTALEQEIGSLLLQRFQKIKPRQCRDRYMNYLAPGFIISEWTKEEDILLAQKYIEFGPHWTIIQRFFPTRTTNAIKNRFKYALSKKMIFPTRHQSLYIKFFFPINK